MEYKVEDSVGIVVGLGFGGSIRVFIIVGKFVGEISRGNGIGVDDGSIIISD